MSDTSRESSHIVETRAGLCGLWQYEHFVGANELDTWEAEVADGAALASNIENGIFVPLNVGGDGSFQVIIRESSLTDREGRYLLVSSEPYLLVSEGVVHLGGLENVGSYIGGSHAISLAKGRYSVRVHLLDWKAEPGAVSETGDPTSEALPDFVVEVSLEPMPAPNYRIEVETFERSS